jgi:hypothetical protein
VRPGTIRLDSLLRYVEEVADVDLRVDWRELEQHGSPRDRAVTIDLASPTGADVLRAALAPSAANDPYPLAFQIEGGAVRVSTREVLEVRVVTRAYDVRDLVADAVRLRGVVKDLRSPRPPASGPSARQRAAERSLFGGGDVGATTGPATRPAALLSPAERVIDPSSWNSPPPQPAAQTPEEFEKDAVEELLKFVEHFASQGRANQFRGGPLYFGGRLLVTGSAGEQERVVAALRLLRGK